MSPSVSHISHCAPYFIQFYILFTYYINYALLLLYICPSYSADARVLSQLSSFSFVLFFLFPHKDFPLMDRATLLPYLRTLTAGGHTFHLITPLLDLPPLPQLNFQFNPFPSFTSTAHHLLHLHKFSAPLALQERPCVV